VSFRNNLLPRSIKRVKLRHPTKSTVLENIKQCSIAHFACHGEVNPDPSKSRILLSDWETVSFSVSDMARIKLSQGQLGYLSTCHAANNRNLALLDEAIQMAGACQLAGFPAVVGALWQIPDEQSARVAECVYRAMLTGAKDKLDIRKAANGLHFAIREIREKSRLKMRSRIFSSPVDWAPYIHVGV
jgi:CHAT domain-containing protein